MIQYLIGSLGVLILLSFSALGSCSGMSSCAASSILYANKPMIMTYAYIAMIMISTGFFYAFILAIVVINKLDIIYTLETSVWCLSACILFGGTALACGSSMGKVSKGCFRRIVQEKSFFITFLLSLASLEVTLVLAFLICLIIIHKH